MLQACGLRYGHLQQGSGERDQIAFFRPLVCTGACRNPATGSENHGDVKYLWPHGPYPVQGRLAPDPMWKSLADIEDLKTWEPGSNNLLAISISFLAGSISQQQRLRAGVTALKNEMLTANTLLLSSSQVLRFSGPQDRPSLSTLALPLTGVPRFLNRELYRETICFPSEGCCSACASLKSNLNPQTPTLELQTPNF